MTNDKKCENCIYLTKAPVFAQHCLGKQSKQKIFFGYCKRHAPTYPQDSRKYTFLVEDKEGDELGHTEEVLGKFPVVSFNNWCGEFKENE